MDYRKLSEQVEQLSNPQRSDIFVREFRTAVREGMFDAADLPERVAYPKVYSRRGGEGGTYNKDYKDMIFAPTADFEAWFSGINDQLEQNKRKPSLKPSFDAYVKGDLSFEEAAQRTRERMQASQAKGQKLGAGRAKATAGKGVGRPKNAPKR